MNFLDVVASETKMMLTSEFAVDVTITVGENTVTLKGLFDNTFEIVDPETRTRVLSDDARVTVWEDDIPFSVRKLGVVITIGGKNYKLRVWEPDNQGCITLYLD